MIFGTESEKVAGSELEEEFALIPGYSIQVAAGDQ